MKIFQKIKLNINFKKQQSGFVLLFAVVITSIILSITLGLSDSTLKELSFGTSSKGTGDAFFAADTGIECALYYDFKWVVTTLGNNINPYGIQPTDGDNFTIECAGTDLALNLDQYGSSTPDGPWYFVLPNLGSLGKACAIVKVDRTTNPGTTIVISKGYNLGGDTLDCTSSNPNRIEREIELQYATS